MEKPSFFIMDFQSSFEVLLRHKIFYLHTFDNKTTVLLKTFENLTFDDAFKMYC